MKTQKEAELKKYLEATESDFEEKRIEEYLLENDEAFSLQKNYLSKFRETEMPEGYSPFDKISKKKRNYEWLKVAAVILVLISTSLYLLDNRKYDAFNEEWNTLAMNEKLLLLRGIENGESNMDNTMLKSILYDEKDINIRLYVVDILEQQKDEVPLQFKEDILENEDNPMLQVAMVNLFANETKVNINTEHLTGLANEKLNDFLR